MIADYCAGRLTGRSGRSGREAQEDQQDQEGSLDITGRSARSGRDSPNPLSHRCDVEIEDQSYLASPKLQVSDHLRFVDRRQAFDRLDLDDDRAFDEQVQPVSTVNLDSAVDDWKRNLLLKIDAPHDEFVFKTCLISGFEQARPKCTVDVNRGADNLFGPVSAAINLERHAKGMMHRYCHAETLQNATVALRRTLLFASLPGGGVRGF
jgi:hypothetical protein